MSPEINMTREEFLAWVCARLDETEAKRKAEIERMKRELEAKVIAWKDDEED